MQKHSKQSQLQTLENSPLQATWHVKSDLHVLHYMVHRIRLHLLNAAASTALPSIQFAAERRNRAHRIAVYRQQELMLNGNLLFVGFISGIQPGVSPAIVKEIHHVDKIFMAELANNPGLLSYSSLELNKGHWYNLVLLSNLEAKTYFKESSAHSYAAYKLAMHYYAWIRLHNGIMSGHLEGHQMLLQSTKYYTFPALGQQPLMQEVSYDTNCRDPIYRVRHASTRSNAR